MQEQLTMTIRLFFSGNLVRGELSEPEHPDAIIEPLGKQREYSATAMVYVTGWWNAAMRCFRNNRAN